jgi:ribulose-phosphate 3-epimerase
MAVILAPSLLSADFGNLNREIEMLNESTAQWIHCDIMDGWFVPNISFGIPVLKAVSKIAVKPLDVHLMVERPERYISEFRDAGASVLSVHAEATIHLDRTLHGIKQAGMMTGVAINPSTPVTALLDVLYLTDVVCMMSVNPGFGGQKFIENTFNKLILLKEIITKHKFQTKIEIDGGVSIANAQALYKAGADILVAGNSVFSQNDPKAAISELIALAS